MRSSCGVELIKLVQEPHRAFLGLSNLKAEQVEIARLQCGIAKLKMQRDRLKKQQRRLR